MNKFIARIYSGALEFIHGLFFLALIVFTIYVFNADDEIKENLWIIVLIYLAAIGTWIVIFGFITTIVVMARTLDEIKAQNEAMLSLIREASIKHASAGDNLRSPAPTTAGATEPFIGGSATRI